MGGGGGKWKARFRFMSTMAGTARVKSSVIGLRGSLSVVHPLNTLDCRSLRVSLNLGMRRHTCLLRARTLITEAWTDFECRPLYNCESNTAKRWASLVVPCRRFPHPPPR